MTRSPARPLCRLAILALASAAFAGCAAVDLGRPGTDAIAGAEARVARPAAADPGHDGSGRAEPGIAGTADGTAAGAAIGQLAEPSAGVPSAGIAPAGARSLREPDLVRAAPRADEPGAAAAVRDILGSPPSPAIGDAPVMTRERGPVDVPAAAASDLWERIRSGFAMPELRSPLVEQRTRWYIARPDLLERMFERGAPYLYFIVEEIRKRRMPMELALLPFVESAMDPTALSRASAAGLWQFIPATGLRFDLSQDWWIDQRRDVVASTRAALDYLQEVYTMHGDDWFLALASYNWGENAVARAVRTNRARGRPTGYLHLRMPEETRHYVPKLLALRRIVADADKLGIALPPVPDAPYFVTIEHSVPMDVKLAARFADMSVEDFVALNPAHNRPVIAATRYNEIRLPVDRVEAFVAAAERHARQRRPFVSWRPHTLTRGETIESIAARTGATPGEIRRANGLPASRRLRAGSKILVPASGAVDASYVDSFDAPRLLWHPPPREVPSRAVRTTRGSSAILRTPRATTRNPAATRKGAGAKVAGRAARPPASGRISAPPRR